MNWNWHALFSEQLWKPVIIVWAAFWLKDRIDKILALLLYISAELEQQREN